VARILSTKSFAQILLEWFETKGDKYPFRETSDPYRILVSEILLRQTTAKQVAKVYEDFFSKFPTIERLRGATSREIAQAIRPLGIVSRACDLAHTAQIIVDEYGGRIPDDETALMSLRGVGRYVADCVLVLAYQKSLPMIDVNVKRVLCRVLGLGYMDRDRIRDEVSQAYLRLAPSAHQNRFHYALIDLAHNVCKKRKPACDDCPIRGYCKSAKKC
jgi:A/G-specific adenine glycosylase